MSSEFDIIIVGLGAMGSAAFWQFAKAGARVLGIDQFASPHASGSSHGQTRIIREAYFEHPIYVPLVQRAYTLWDELQQAAGKPLLEITGGLMIGRPGSEVFEGAKRSAQAHKLAHEILSSAEVARRFPGLRPDPEMLGVLEPRAGFIYPERCIEAFLKLGQERGGNALLNETVESWSASSSGVGVKTGTQTIRAKYLVLAAGPWMPKVAAELGDLLVVERQVLYWFRPGDRAHLYEVGGCPVHIWEYAPGLMFYGFPDIGRGVKVAKHHQGAAVTPESVDRRITENELAEMRQLVRQFLPEANGDLLEATVCLYTNTPDEHLLVDWHPRHSNVVIASPCSGHGFKFASAIGEMVRDLVLKGSSPFAVDLFRLKRFAR